jgi:hypothetical protein
MKVGDITETLNPRCKPRGSTHARVVHRPDYSRTLTPADVYFGRGQTILLATKIDGCNTN